MKTILVPYTFFLYINVILCIDLRVDPLVFISQGLVRGYKVDNGDFAAFEGIPYAKVDLDNPFGPSQEPSHFEEVIFDANDKSVKCPQLTNINGKETIDCLRLNIYVPNSASRWNPLPVLVWIHGGGFMGGSGGEYNVQHLVKQGIVVVTINYRLGPYGFMCLGSSAVPGNQGLRDQYEALRWVRNNIGAFGGNPYKVTIAGESAGSASVLLQLYSPKPKLFEKIIMESGTPLVSDMFVEGDEEAAIKLAQYLGFNTDDTDMALTYLTTAPNELLLAAVSELDLDFKPCREKVIDGVDIFVDSYPSSLTNSRKVRDTLVMIGHTSIEELHPVITNDPFYDILQNNFNLETETLSELAKLVRHYYIGDASLSGDVNLLVANFQSDFYFNHAVQKTIDKLLEEDAKAVYQYVFSYVGDSVAPGAIHASEVQYLFSNGGSEADNLITERMAALWSNFIIYGNPTPAATAAIPIIWKPVDANTRPYLDIDKELQLKSRVYHDRLAFWDLFYKAYGDYHRYH